MATEKGIEATEEAVTRARYEVGYQNVNRVEKAWKDGKRFTANGKKRVGWCSLWEQRMRDIEKAGDWLGNGDVRGGGITGLRQEG